MQHFKLLPFTERSVFMERSKTDEYDYMEKYTLFQNQTNAANTARFSGIQ